ncbi:hypothetical protein H6P81_003556 [Aristolochia fimbriata]|uniref:AP2/ERF domain-containing protein n=1 Tax=Aristolochia fimbriata TaxID=158543 RepID=A0AAV7FH46_ARIFI|nr:hypothetical protein H6P81_003556 [Aristolochia fimbriata]
MDVVEGYSYSSSSSTELAVTTHKKRAGRKKFRDTRHPFFRGVRQRGQGGKWVCQVREPQKKSRIWLGTFPSPEMAARAYDVAAVALRGPGAPLNFENSRQLLPRPVSSEPVDIRAAARAAAEAFRDDDRLRTTSSELFFHDEEAECNMPSLLASMAEGMLITPPGVHHGGMFEYWDDLEDPQMDLSLWND